jgi:hypothetical protein
MKPPKPPKSIKLPVDPSDGDRFVEFMISIGAAAAIYSLQEHLEFVVTEHGIPRRDPRLLAFGEAMACLTHLAKPAHDWARTAWNAGS